MGDRAKKGRLFFTAWIEDTSDLLRISRDTFGDFSLTRIEVKTVARQHLYPGATVRPSSNF